MTVSRTICLGFLGVILVGTLLLMMPFSLVDGTWDNPVTALFTSTSAVCVTGLVVVDTGTHYSFWGQLIVVVLIQVGGLGYMTATTFLLLLLGGRFKLRYRLAVQQSLDATGLSNVVQLVRSFIATTVLIQLTGVFLLMLVFVPERGFQLGVWNAVFHSISAFNNAGFSLFSDSLVQYVDSPFVNFTIPMLVILGGIGYQVIMETYYWLKHLLFQRSERFCFSLHFKVVTNTTLFLLIGGTIIFFLTELHNPETLAPLGFGGKVMAAWFQSTIARTAGFNSIDIGHMTNAALFATMALMLIGASPGSTGGGLKTTTVRVLANCTTAVLRGRDEVLLYQRQVPTETILKAVGCVMGSMATIVIATMLITITDPKLDFIQVVFEVFSAFATVGLSTGITAQVSVWAKLVIIAVMYVGRVSVLMLMSALIGDPKPSAVDYPQEDLLVG
ncbi:MAG: ATPase [Cyanobacteria bacterium J055]|nr:MAG: ATPase [Cyanobacteria bacterium J055]